MASWNVDVKYVFIPNWIHLDLLPCARKLFWLRSRVHAGKILDQIQKRTEPYGSALVCTGPKSVAENPQPHGMNRNKELLRSFVYIHEVEEFFGISKNLNYI